MILNDIQLCRCAAFRDGLILADSKPSSFDSNGNPVFPLDDKTKVAEGSTRQTATVKALQNYTEERSTDYAMQYGVDFPNETLPDTPASMIAQLPKRGRGRPSHKQQQERLQKITHILGENVVNDGMQGFSPDNWADLIDDSAAYQQ